MVDRLKVVLADVLWRTRGRDWDYAFLLQPPPLLSEGWYTLHRRIFANVEADPKPVLLRGALGIGTGQPFFATAFTDAVRRDSQGRPIAHYLSWFGPGAEAAPGVSFGPELVSALAPAFDAVFLQEPEALKRGETKPLDALLRAGFASALTLREVALVVEVTSGIRWLGTLAP
jgi:hypothetical protein